MGDDLVRYGWNQTLADQFASYAAEGLIPGRIAREHTHLYRVYTAGGDLLARVTGRFRHEARGRQDFPTVGDWVAVRPAAGAVKGAGNAQIHGLLPRKSRFSRKIAGASPEEQVVAANVDTIFLVSALDGDFNLRRLERYLVVARESRARPVIVLNKADLCADVSEAVTAVQTIAPDIPAHAISCLRAEGLDQLAAYLRRGKTVALLGSSGVGKSTLINTLLGEERQRIRDVRAGDRRGRHATTNRELIVMPGGALMIDTPGLRELQLWEIEDGLQDTFDDIEALAPECFFRDCQHLEEPRCAVKAAAGDGRMSTAHLESYHKLKRELRELKKKTEYRRQKTE